MATGGLIGTVLLAAAAVCLTSGCSTLGYYAQAAGGHLELLQRARPVAEVLADPATPEPLRQRLQRSQQMRDFAARELQLPDNNSYRRYADLQREAVVWNVVAAPELGLTLKTWCFPVMGCVGYRGYFSREAAEATAAQLKAEGWEVMLYGVPAYSTLGWSNWVGGDPLLNTFVTWSEPELARLIFHELAHQVVYVADDTTFNESYATAVERLGGRLWLAQHGSAAALAEVQVSERRREDFRAITARTRQRLLQVYAGPGSDEQKRQAKAEVMATLQAEYTALKAGPWAGFSGYDGWFARANNASFGVLAAYNELVPGFEQLFEAQGRDWLKFHGAVKELAALPRDERRTRLRPPAAAASSPATP
ncbi:aminopeptidase [beta proteobacterium AAP121]|nr:aminopeptidase [beta proteobacterium AAP65]KPF97831.1 aminopeptidase [beta proteobacterium AAP121]